MALKTNYKDDIPISDLRKYQMRDNGDGTVSFVDVTEYEQEGDTFGAGDINATNQAVNEKLDSADVVDPALATVLGFAADAKLTGDALSELNKNLGVKVYSDLTSIGLTDANVTKEALYGAIPNHSRLSKAVWKSNWTSFDFPSTAGNYIAIEFTKYDAGYACVELYDLYNNKKYLSSYNGSSKAWSDWSALN